MYRQLDSKLNLNQLNMYVPISALQDSESISKVTLSDHFMAQFPLRREETK